MIEIGEQILQPISGESPCGVKLRGGQIREIEALLREDLSGTAVGGMLIRAQPKQAAENALRILSTQSKDLNIAVLLTEALARVDGFAGLNGGLELLRELLTRYWDTLHPEIEDEDEEIRAGPLLRLGGKSFLASMLQIPITVGGYTDIDRQMLAAIPSEVEAREDQAKGTLRRAAETKGCVTPEAFEKSFKSSDYQFFAGMASAIASSYEALGRLEAECEARFTDPKVRGDAITAIRTLGAGFGKYKEIAAEALRIRAPEAPAEQPSPGATRSEPNPKDNAAETTGQPPATVSGAIVPPVPEDPAEIGRFVLLAARNLRKANPASATSYLLARAWIFGNALEAGPDGPDRLAPPSRELREDLFRLHSENDWQALLERAEDSLDEPCASCWLDLQYYSGAAMQNLGESFEAAFHMISGCLRLYLARFPGLDSRLMLDGTPAANATTIRWIESLEGSSARHGLHPIEGPTPPSPGKPENAEDMEDLLALAGSGRVLLALETLRDRSRGANTGKSRFDVNARVAQLCMAGAQHEAALPVLRALRTEIEQRRLEEWDPALCVDIFRMLYSCLRKVKAGQEEITDIFSRVCILDPVTAFHMAN